MGGGAWDSTSYTSASTTRAATGVKDFAYTATAKEVHPSLKAIRIKDKVHGVLESRDSVDHPNSIPVLMCFDVTGSNIDRAEVAQKKLPTLMDLLKKYNPDTHVATAANDDFATSDKDCIQISEFEADNRVDDHIRNIWLIGRGGANSGESYELLFYAAARKIKHDAMEKRGKKGYMFVYADEPLFNIVKADEVKATFGDTIQRDIPLEEMLEEARRSWEIFILTADRDYMGSKASYQKYFDSDHIIEVQDPNLICELVASVFGLHEGKTDAHNLVTDLVHVGANRADAEQVKSALSKISKGGAVVVPGGGAAAARL